MTQIIDENSEFHAPEISEPPHSTAVSAVVSAGSVSADLPSPIAEANTGLPAHLQDLTERARGYVAAASSANTRKA